MTNNVPLRNVVRKYRCEQITLLYSLTYFETQEISNIAEENAYILGTEREELYRLGLQHQVWSGETRKG